MRMKELAIPVQALMAILTCISLGWMVYAMAFFDPNPPTAAEVHMMQTQDPEMNVYRTAAAMTVDALLFGPTQIVLPLTGATPIPIATSTFGSIFSTLVVLPTQTATPSPVVVASATERSGGHPASVTPSSTPRTPTLTAVPTNSPTSTLMPSATPESPTPTPPPTATTIPSPTDPPPTETTAPTPTDQPSPTAVPTDPPTDTPTAPPPATAPAS